MIIGSKSSVGGQVSTWLRVEEDRVVVGSATAFPLTLVGVTPGAISDLERLFQDSSAAGDPAALERGLAGIISRFAIRCVEIDEYVDANRALYKAVASPLVAGSGSQDAGRQRLHVRLDVDLDVLFAAEHQDASRLAATVREFGFENLRFYERIARRRSILRIPMGHRDRAISENLLVAGLMEGSSAIPTEELIDEMPMKEINSIATQNGRPGYSRKTALKNDLRTDPEFASTFRAALGTLDYCRAAPFPAGSNGITLPDVTAYLTRCQVVAELIARTYSSAHFWSPPDEQLNQVTPFVQVLGIPDDRMCGLCTEENGKVYLSTKTPPRPFHLACRCMLSLIPYPEAIRMGLAVLEGKRLKILNANPGKVKHEAAAHPVVERATDEGDKKARWATIGDLGRSLERGGRLDEAMKLWRDAFDEGSSDPDTVSRLSMHLERAKDYAGSVAVIREALNRGLPANVEESLHKRLTRCEDKTADREHTKTRKRADVPAYSVRRESSQFEPIFQIRLKPSVKDLELVGQTARCLLASKGSSTLVDIDLTTGSEVRRVENLPLLGDTWFAPDGRGIGVRRTAAIGQGPTLLRFLDGEGRVAAESSVPDATSEIALGPDLWYVGCRNGLLYAFGLDGRQRWAWETPGSKDYNENPYFRPCPYYVSSRQSFAAVASMGNIYAVGPNGRTIWRAALPNEGQTCWKFTIPLEGDHGSREAYGILGLPSGASRDEVKSAYRRLALETHPDRNPRDSDAAAKFRLMQGAYERILAAPAASESASGGITLSMGFQGSGPTASFLAANAEGVVVGSSQGRLYLFDANGSLREARVLGDGPVRVALRHDGTVGAAWCSHALMFFKEDKIVNAAGALNWPRALTMLGDDVVLWQGNEVQVMDAMGRLLWSVEFSKNITGVAAHGDTLVCAAGVLTAFRRSRDGG